MNSILLISRESFLYLFLQRVVLNSSTISEDCAINFMSQLKFSKKITLSKYLAVPVIEQIEEKLDHESLFAYYFTITEFKNQINIRKKKTMHWELLLSEFSLTPSGRLWLRKKIERNNPRAL